jgi:predicted DNA-binding transcriptional regulator YafY
MLNFKPGCEYEFTYTTSKGDTSVRQVLMTGLGVSEKGSWSLKGYDVQKKQYRTFVLDSIDVPSAKYLRG